MKINIDNDSSLLGAIDASFFKNKNMFLTLRDSEGNVLWSHAIKSWSRTLDDACIDTEPVEDVIERELKTARFFIETNLSKIGVL